MSHTFLTWRSCVVLASSTGFFYYLSQSFKGPETSKWDLPKIPKERYSNIPGFDTLFSLESHPGLRKD